MQRMLVHVCTPGYINMLRHTLGFCVQSAVAYTYAHSSVVSSLSLVRLLSWLVVFRSLSGSICKARQCNLMQWACRVMQCDAVFSVGTVVTVGTGGMGGMVGMVGTVGTVGTVGHGGHGGRGRHGGHGGRGVRGEHGGHRRNGGHKSQNSNSVKPNLNPSLKS